jgi:DNA-binding beta-propeller fold protein YncE
MSAQPTLAQACRGLRPIPGGVALLPASDPVPESGGLMGVISAVLVALGRRPLRRPEGSTAAAGEPAVTPEVIPEVIPEIIPEIIDAGIKRDERHVRTVAGVGPVSDIALSPDGRYAYVAASDPDRGHDSAGWTVKVVDTETNTVVKTIDNLAGAIPTGLAASPDSSRLYVADRNCAAIRVVDIQHGSPSRNRVVDSLRLDGSLPVGYGTPTAISLSPNGSRLYVLMTDSAVLIVDPDTGVLVGTVSGGDSIAMFASSERIYVCADNRLGQTNVTAGVVILDADTGNELGAFGLNDAPAIIRQPILAGSRGQLYLDTDDLDGRLEVVDTSTLNVVTRIRIDESADRELRSIPAGAVLSPDGRYLYVANQGVRLSSEEATEVGWVSVVDTRLNKVIHDIALPQAGIDECRGANPQFIAIGPAGDLLVVVSEYGFASIIDTASRSVIETAALGEPTDQPRVVMVNEARNAVYVGTSGDDGLTVIAL